MKKKAAKLLLKMCGWKKLYSYPDLKKFVCVMAPHTSMWDFVWGKLYFMSFGIKPRILVKSEVFTWYLGPILKALGGIPVYRRSPIGLVEHLLKYFNENENFVLVIAAEGTRKKVDVWKTGAVRIANYASVPIVTGGIDYKRKEMGVVNIYHDVPKDLHFINVVKRDFINLEGKHPEQFNAAYEQ
jgi:1-acyl-sn-glycerol-3-phosphate acyltransferase